MDAENKPAENVTEAASPPATLGVALPARNASHNDAGGRAGPAANDKSTARWRLILLVLCAVGAGLVIGILALQVTEYLFYKAPPDVWPPRRPAAGQGATLPQTWQSGAGGTVSTPATVSVPLSPVIPAIPPVILAPVTATTAPLETATSTVPVAAATVAAPSEAATSSGVTSMPAVAATSAPAPAATMP